MKLSNQYFGLFGDSQTSTSKTNIIKKVEEPFEEEEVRNDKPNLNHTNSNQCVVCYSLNLKYKCPECEMRTCSLDCVNNHKLKFECSGKKNFSSYKKLSELDDVTFLKDYLFLEDCNRLVDNFRRDIKARVKSQESLPSWLKKLVYEAKIRGTKLKILPAGFKKRTKNKTAFMYSLKQIYWDVEFKFSHLVGKTFKTDQIVSITCNRVSETLTLEKLLFNLFNPNPILEPKQFKIFSLYRNTDPENVVAHLQQEKNLIKVDIKSSLKDILSGKVIIEYPTIYISLIKSDLSSNSNSNLEIESDEYDQNM